MRSLLIAVLIILSAGAQAAEGKDVERLQQAQASTLATAEQLLDRGDELLEQKDIASARLFYEMALEEGSGEAAAKLGMSYDPIRLQELGFLDSSGDSDKAIEWYRQALDRGHSEVRARLEGLVANRILEESQPPDKIEGSEPAVAEAPALGSPEKPDADSEEAADGEITPVVERPETGEPPEASNGTGSHGAIEAKLEPVDDAVETDELEQKRIQVGALKSEEAAQEEGKEIQLRHQNLLGGKEISVERLNLSGGRGIMFGVQVGPFTDEAAADALCSRLRSEGQDCFVVP